MLRVLHLARTIVGTGGLEPHLISLGLGTIAAGNRVAIAANGGSQERITEFSKVGIRTYQVAFPGPALTPRACTCAVRSLWDLWSVFREFRPELIHVHYRATSPYAQLAQWTRGIPFVSTLHLTGIPRGRLHRAVSCWGKRVIVLSEEGRDYLVSSFGVDSSRIRLVPHGIDETHFRPPSPEERAQARRQFQLKDHDKVIAMVARMDRVKGQDVLLDALLRLRDTGIKAVALLAGTSIAGDVAWRDHNLERARAAGIADSVRFLGHADSRSVFWASDVSVLPSRQEGFALTVVESMMCGVVPVRTPAAGAAAQIRDGVDGFVIPFDDAAALADRLRLLLEDGERRKQMVASAVTRARLLFTARTMIENTLTVYREALDRN